MVNLLFYSSYFFEHLILFNISFFWGRYDARSSTLEWSILLIDNTNRRYELSITIKKLVLFFKYVFFINSGSMEFVVPPADPSTFFPINIRFTAVKTFSDVKVCHVESRAFSFLHVLTTSAAQR